MARLHPWRLRLRQRGDHVRARRARLPYLLKLRHTGKVKELVNRMMRQGARWQDCGDGWQALETTIRLSGWTKQRRVILVRENPAQAPVREPGKSRRGKDRQTLLPHAQGSGWDAKATPWSGKIAVLVTSLDEQAFPTQVIPKHYRDRADAENCFDELKNQWGWNGYTSRRLVPSRLMANLVALFYNWWNLYLRFYYEENHREAIIRNRCATSLSGARRERAHVPFQHQNPVVGVERQETSKIHRQDAKNAKKSAMIPKSIPPWRPSRLGGEKSKLLGRLTPHGRRQTDSAPPCVP